MIPVHRTKGMPQSATLAKKDPRVLAKSDPGPRMKAGLVRLMNAAEIAATTMHGVPSLVRARALCTPSMRLQ